MNPYHSLMFSKLCPYYEYNVEFLLISKFVSSLFILDTMDNSNDEKISLCNICLDEYQTHFKEVDNLFVDMLKTLSLELEQTTCNASAICDMCLENVKKCYDFKSTCLCTENSIKTFTNNQDVRVNLEEIYLNKPNSTGLDIIPKGYSVCRLCIDMVKSDDCIYLNDESQDVTLLNVIFIQYFSELNLDITENPVICFTCHTSLRNYFNFMSNSSGLQACCQETERERSHSPEFIMEDCIKNETDSINIGTTYIKGENEDRSNQHSVRTEIPELVLKYEEIDIDSNELKSERSKLQEKKYVCRFCLKKSCEFESIDENHRKILKELLLTMDLAVSHEPVICKTCTHKFQSCFAFKTALLHVKEHVSFSNGGAVNSCLFCKKIMLYDGFISLDTEQVDIVLLKAMMQQYFPELILRDITYPVICLICYGRLQNFFDFIESCVNTEEQIKKYCEAVGTNNRGQIELESVVRLGVEKVTNISRVDTKGSLCINRDKGQKYEETLVSPDFIKVERIWGDEIKIEEKWLHEGNMSNKLVDTISEAIDAVVKRWQNYKQESTPGECDSDKADSNKVHTKGDENVAPKENYKVSEDCTDGIKDSENRCRKEWWATIGKSAIKNRIQNKIYFSKSELRTMITKLDIAGEKKYQCQVCNFVSKVKCSVNRHMTIHQNPSELTLYHCHQCDFKSKRKGDLAHHMESHKDRSKKPWYQCLYCPFQTLHKRTIKFHNVKHSDCPDVPMFECYICGFKTCSKRRLTYHVNSHGKPKPETTMYKCDKCSYETNRRYALKYHVVTHMHPSELSMYKCDCCEYETKHKCALKRHVEIHREPVDCIHCQFNSKYSNILRRHYQRAHGMERVDGSLLTSF